MILNQADVKETVKTDKTPQELMQMAGYDLYKCETGGDIKQFKKYYEKDEELCTFRNGANGENRLKKNHIWWAVRKDAAQIKRAEKPRREDDYGVSVISIQVSKTGNWLSIKNRYNHTVDNPDATFGNNLDNIIPGLTDAFNQKYNLNIYKTQSNTFGLNKYIRAGDGKYYRYNDEYNNIYYCPGNIIIDNGEVKKFDKSKYTLMDTFILSKENLPKITSYDITFNNRFLDLYDIRDRKVQEEKKENEQGEEYTEITLVPTDGKSNDIKIKLDKSSNIIGYENKDTLHIDDNFLNYNQTLKELTLPNVKTIRDNFLSNNYSLTELDMPQLTSVGNSFLFHPPIRKIHLPNLTTVKDKFLYMNKLLTELDLPELTTTGNDFLIKNKSLKEINLSKLKTVGANFLYSNQLPKLNLPELATVGSNFMHDNNSLTELDLPELKRTLYCFLHENRKLTKINLPKLEHVGYCFLYNNNSLEELELPELIDVGDDFLYNNNSIKKLNLPNLTTANKDFLENNMSLEILNLPKLRNVHLYFFGHHSCNFKSPNDINMPLLPESAYNAWAGYKLLKKEEEREI